MSQANFFCDTLPLFRLGGTVSAFDPARASPFELVVTYGGWSLGQLWESSALGPPDKRIVLSLHRLKDYEWIDATFQSGVYAFQIPVANSDNMSFSQACGLLSPPKWRPVEAVLGATALLALLLSGRDDPLNGGWLSCAEQVAQGYHPTLRRLPDNKFGLANTGGTACSGKFIGAVQKIA